VRQRLGFQPDLTTGPSVHCPILDETVTVNIGWALAWRIIQICQSLELTPKGRTLGKKSHLPSDTNFLQLFGVEPEGLA
jgi:hypothetical protein